MTGVARTPFFATGGGTYAFFSYAASTAKKGKKRHIKADKGRKRQVLVYPGKKFPCMKKRRSCAPTVAS